MITIDLPYTGHMSPGSNPQQRDIPGGRIVKMSVGGMDNNCYLVQCTATRAALLIDAANEPDRIEALITQETPGRIALIVTTHLHRDHWWALKDIAAATSAPTAAHRLDADALPIRPDRLLDDGDLIDIGDLRFEAIHLRGHTPGSVALALIDDSGAAHLFTGDSLFPGGVGKTAGPKEFASLYADVTQKIFDRYPDDAIVYPGHGDDTTLGTERPHLAEWRERGW